MLLLVAAAAVLRCDGRQALLLRDTVLLGLAVAGLSVPPGTLLAVLLVRSDVPGRGLGLALVAAMLFVPLYLVAAAWDAGFGQLGWLSLSWGSVDLPLLSGWRAALWIHALAAIPWVTLIVGIAARQVEPQAEEEAWLSAHLGRVFLRVTLPRIAPAVAVAALWSWLSVVGEMTVTDLYRVRTYAEELYTGFALGDDLAASTAAVWPGMALTATMAVAAWLVAHWLAPAGRTPRYRPFVYPLGRWRWLGGACLIGVLLLVVGVPVGNLLYKAGLELRDLGPSRVRVWSPAILVSNLLAVPWRYGESFGWSGLVAGLAATLALPCAVTLAWPARRGGWRAIPAVAVAAVGLAIPAPVIGLALIRVLDQPIWPGLVWLYDETVLAPVLAMLIRVLPPAILFGWYVLRTIGDDVLDAAAGDGAGPGRRLWWIVLPQRRVGLAAAWLFAFCLSSGELAASILVTPPGVSTLPIRVFGLIHAGVDDQVAALCLFTWAGVGVLVGGLFWLAGRRKNGLY